MKVLPLQIPEDLYEAFAANAQARGQTPADSLRTLVAWSNEQARLSAATIDVTVTSEPIPDAVRRMHPEHIAVLTASVTSTVRLPIDLLDRLVFVLPEFFDNRGHETFRVDSFHNHRVCCEQVCISSDRVNRNVLSFRLANGQWQAGVFNYGSEDTAEVVEQIKVAVNASIRDTLTDYLSGLLPPAHLLSEEDLRSYRSVFSPALSVIAHDK